MMGRALYSLMSYLRFSRQTYYALPKLVCGSNVSYVKNVLWADHYIALALPQVRSGKVRPILCVGLSAK